MKRVYDERRAVLNFTSNVPGSEENSFASSSADCFASVMSAKKLQAPWSEFGGASWEPDRMLTRFLVAIADRASRVPGSLRSLSKNCARFLPGPNSEELNRPGAKSVIAFCKSDPNLLSDSNPARLDKLCVRMVEP